MIVGLYLAVALVGGAVALIGWVLARVRTAPGQVRPDAGPIVRSYPVPGAHLLQAVETAVAGTRGATVAHRRPGELVLDVRPSAGRLDDGMGLFVSVAIEDRNGHSSYRIVGQAKSGLAVPATTRRGLTSFERDLRMRMKQLTGLAVIGS